MKKSLQSGLLLYTYNTIWIIALDLTLLFKTQHSAVSSVFVIIQNKKEKEEKKEKKRGMEAHAEIIQIPSSKCSL